MELILSKKHENRIEFVADGISPGFGNTIRRYVMNQVKVLAMDHATFYDNTSSFWDEYLAHRVGLIPILTPDKTPESAEIIFSLDVTGPKTVLAKDFKSSDKGINVALEDVVLVTLTANQHLRLEAIARLGSGVEHAKFQAGLITYGIDEGKMKFIVESFYQMKPGSMIVRACNRIVSDLDAIANAFGEKKTKKPAAKKATVKKTTAKKTTVKKTTTKKPAAKKKATKKK